MTSNAEWDLATRQAGLLLTRLGLPEDHARAFLDSARTELLRGALGCDEDRRNFAAQQAEAFGGTGSVGERVERWHAAIDALLLNAECGAALGSLVATSGATSIRPQAIGLRAPHLSSATAACFVWPARGAMQITLLRGGGCTIRITFASKGAVKSIGKGRVIKAVDIPTKRIARRYEVLIRHDGDFESSYSIVDQTPGPAVGSRHLTVEGQSVDDGGRLYDVRNGGFLHFQLAHRGKLVDPRRFMKKKFEGDVDVIDQSFDM